MLGFGKKALPDQQSAPNQKFTVRKALGIAFNPGIGAGLRPLQETTDVFVQLLAMVFISLKMFPANHPAYLGISGKKLTLPLLLSFTWNDLKFSKESAPQLLMFFAVIFSLAFSALALALFLLSLFVHTAHAQGYFTYPNQGSDIAQKWLDFLFNNGQLNQSDSWPFDTLPIVQQLQKALAFYSNAILIVAAIILFYHLIAMTAETAHEGVVMGKRANQIWAPIRLVVAIGLLVPTASGLNSGQYIVLKMTSWGSALASNVWDIFLGGLNGGGNNQGVAFVPMLAQSEVYNTFLSQACLSAYKFYYTKDVTAPTLQNDYLDKKLPDESPSGGNVTRYITSTDIDTVSGNSCGGYAFADQNTQGNQAASATNAAVKAKSTNCFDTMKKDLRTYADQLIVKFTPDKGIKDRARYDGHLENTFATYMGCISDLPKPNVTWAFTQSSQAGWVAAGALVSSISQAEADSNNLSGLIPNTMAPNTPTAQTDATMGKALTMVNNLAAYVKTPPTGGAPAGSPNIGTDACSSARGDILKSLKTLANGTSRDHLMERIFEFIDLMAGWNCVYVSKAVAEPNSPYNEDPKGFSVGIQYQSGVNPLAAMAHLGHANINTAYAVFDMYVNEMAEVGERTALLGAVSPLANRASGVLSMLSQGSTAALTAMGAILVLIVNVFLVSGVMLAYYVPMIPFMQFLFQVLAWAVCVLEAVIAVPLIALAHLTTEGPGLPGRAAQTAYFFIFNIFVRPVLMIFGLMVGLLILYIAVDYMNLFYEMAVSSSSGAGSGQLFLSRLVYTALYVIILYICANNAFKAIGWLPEHANKWMGAQSLHTMQTGDATQAAGTLQSGAQQGSSAITGAVQSGGWGAARALGGGGGLSGGGGTASKLMGAAASGNRSGAAGQELQNLENKALEGYKDGGEKGNTTGPAGADTTSSEDVGKSWEKNEFPDKK